MGSLDDLPPVPRETRSSTRGDAVAGIVFSIVGAVVFLLFPDVLNALSHRADGVPFDPFNVDAFRASAWVVVVWDVRVRRRRELQAGGRPLYEARAGGDVRMRPGSGSARRVLADELPAGRLHAVVQAMQSSGKALEGPVLWAVSNAQTAFCGLVVAALVIDAVDSIVKTVRAR